MTNSLRDGLGYEEIGQPGSQVSNIWVTGSIVTQSHVSGANVYSTADVLGVKLSGTNTFATGSVQSPRALHSDIVLQAGSPFGRGTILQMTARSNISGGMWVLSSGNLAYAGVEGAPIGVAKPGTNVASGGTVDVIIQGVVPMVAEGTIAVGVPVNPGAGAALNCVKAAAAGSALNYSVLSSAGSEGTVFVLIR